MRGVAKPVADEAVDGAGEGIIDTTGDEDKANCTEDPDADAGSRAREGTGAAIAGAGEFDRTGVDAGVCIGSDGFREVCGRYIGGATFGLPGGLSANSRSKRNRKSRPYSSSS